MEGESEILVVRVCLSVCVCECGGLWTAGWNTGRIVVSYPGF